MYRVRKMLEPDFQHIVSVSDAWWGGPSSDRTHPIFFYELGREALVADYDDKGASAVVGFLLGFITPDNIGYVHLVGIHPEHRRKGIARSLYTTFIAACQQQAVHHFKSITTPGNLGSIAFHKAMGFSVESVANYAGPQRERIVFAKKIG